MAALKTKPTIEPIISAWQLPTKTEREYLNIYCKKHIQEKNGNWWIVNEYLTDKKLYAHNEGKNTYGFYLAYYTDLIGFDLDAHETFLNNAFKKAKLKNLYDKVTGAFGWPSLVFKTKRGGGYHVYYKFDKKIFIQTLIKAITTELNQSRAELAKEGIEIRPTHKQAIRAPLNTKHRGRILDRKTLRPIKSGNTSKSEFLKNNILSADRFKVTEFFNFDVSEIINIETVIGQKRALNKNITYIRGAKKDLVKIKQGQTNEYLERQAIRARERGYSPEQAASYIYNTLKNNNIQIKPGSTDFESILFRVQCYYKGHKHKVTDYKKTEKYTGHFEHQAIVNDIYTMLLSNFPELKKKNKTRKKSIKHFIKELVQWAYYIKNLTAFDAMQIQESRNYEYFYHFTKKRKLIPLPRILIKRWNYEATEIIQLLEKAGILRLEKKAFNFYKPADRKNRAMLTGKKLNNTKGFCNYYRLKLKSPTHR